MVKVAGLAFLAICALAPPRQQQAVPAPPREAAERGALAIVRRDGLMLPFASFVRDAWRVTWPLSLPSLKSVPATLKDVPDRWWGTRTPELWRAFLFSGEMRSLEVRGPMAYRTFCSNKLGLRTNYQSPLPLPAVPGDPYPKDGVAVSGYARIEPIETVPEGTPEWKALEASIVKEFDRVETMTIRGVVNDAGWRHPVKEAERIKLPVRLESWYRSPGAEPGWTVSYVEAVRKYPPRPEDKGCGLETVISGWIHHGNGEMKETPSLRGKITYCDRVGVAYMLPFGRLRPREQDYWVYQLSGWDEERYEVARIERRKMTLVVQAYGGLRAACP